MTRFSTVLLTMAAVCFTQNPAIAASAKPVPKPAAPVVAAVEDKAATIARIEAYLTGLTTVDADFNQVNPDGSLSKGKFYLQRPGKMRWEYAAPTPILLVSDGARLVYYDRELDQITYIGMDDTLAGFLAQKTIKLDGPTTKLTKFSSEANVIRATMVQKNKPDEGSLTLEFSDKPLQIRQMDVLDATGQVTHVQLQNAKLGTAIDPKLFVFNDPKGATRKRSTRR